MNLTLFSYEKIDSARFTGKFELQLNPTEFKESIDKAGSNDEELANGGAQYSRSPTFRKVTWDFSFVLDNTGAAPNLPPGCSMAGTSIAGSTDLLNKLFIEADNETHTQPYVKGVWANGDLTIFGKVNSMDLQYTFFDGSGVPLRAKVDMQIESHDTGDDALFRSPDISRMPKVVQGDTLVDLCRKYYDDPSYYIRIAQLNKLSSFRKLKPGSSIEFPPLVK